MQTCLYKRKKKNEMESDDSFIANLWRNKQARKNRSMRPNQQIYTNQQQRVLLVNALYIQVLYKANPEHVLEKKSYNNVLSVLLNLFTV